MESIKVSRSSSWVYRFVHFADFAYGEASDSCELGSDLLKAIAWVAFLTMLCFAVSAWSTWSIIMVYIVTFNIGWGVPPTLYLSPTEVLNLAFWLIIVLSIAVFFSVRWLREWLSQRNRRLGLGRPTVVAQLYRTWRERFCKPIEYVD